MLDTPAQPMDRDDIRTRMYYEWLLCWLRECDVCGERHILKMFEDRPAGGDA